MAVDGRLQKTECQVGRGNETMGSPERVGEIILAKLKNKVLTTKAWTTKSLKIFYK